MTLTPQELARRYPILYHMASYGSWPSLQKHGLLSSSQLAALFGVPDAEQTALLENQRMQCIPLTHPDHGAATLRDQKPMSRKSLGRCLTGCTPEEWFSTLNRRVFFWLCRERLERCFQPGIM